jgi:hypothetical protein
MHISEGGGVRLIMSQTRKAAPVPAIMMSREGLLPEPAPSMSRTAEMYSTLRVGQRLLEL